MEGCVTALGGGAARSGPGKGRPRRALLALALLLLLAGSGLTFLGLGAAAPRGEVRLDVPHAWDGGGSLCYLGCLLMVVKRDHPGLTYQDVLLCANPGSFGSGPHHVPEAAARLGYRVHVAGLGPDYVSFFERDDREPAWRWFRDEAQAWDSLVELLHRGVPPVVHLDLHYIQPDRERASPVFNYLGHAGHLVLVTGYGPGRVTVHDPQRAEEFAAHMPLDRQRFLQAWGARGYGMYFLERQGEPARRPEEEMEQALYSAEEAPARARALAGCLGLEGPLDDARLNEVGGNPVRREALAASLEARGKGQAARYYRRAAEQYRRLLPGQPHPAGPVLERIAWLEELGLRAAGRTPRIPPEWTPPWFGPPLSTGKPPEAWTVEPGRGVGPLRLGMSLEEIPADWSPGPTGRYRDDWGVDRLAYRVYRRQGVMVVHDAAGRVQAVEVLRPEHRTAGGLGHGRPIDEVFQSFGSPHNFCPGDPYLDTGYPDRYMDYYEFGISFGVAQRKVLSLKVYAPYSPDGQRSAE